MRYSEVGGRTFSVRLNSPAVSRAPGFNAGNDCACVPERAIERAIRIEPGEPELLRSARLEVTGNDNFSVQLNPDRVGFGTGIPKCRGYAIGAEVGVQRTIGIVPRQFKSGVPAR